MRVWWGELVLDKELRRAHDRAHAPKKSAQTEKCASGGKKTRSPLWQLPRPSWGWWFFGRFLTRRASKCPFFFELLAGGRGIGSMERTGRSPSKSSASSGSTRDLDFTRTSTLKYTKGTISSRCRTLSWDNKNREKAWTAQTSSSDCQRALVS